MDNFDDSYEDVRRDRLTDFLERLSGDLEVYKRDFREGAHVSKMPEQQVLASTQARVRLQDTLNELYLHMEEDWGVYNAERLYPTESLSNGADTEAIASILGI